MTRAPFARDRQKEAGTFEGASAKQQERHAGSSPGKPYAPPQTTTESPAVNLPITLQPSAPAHIRSETPVWNASARLDGSASAAYDARESVPQIWPPQAEPAEPASEVQNTTAESVDLQTAPHRQPVLRQASVLMPPAATPARAAARVAIDTRPSLHRESSSLATSSPSRPQAPSSALEANPSAALSYTPDGPPTASAAKGAPEQVNREYSDDAAAQTQLLGHNLQPASTPVVTGERIPTPQTESLPEPCHSAEEPEPWAASVAKDAPEQVHLNYSGDAAGQPQFLARDSQPATTPVVTHQPIAAPRTESLPEPSDSAEAPDGAPTEQVQLKKGDAAGLPQPVTHDWRPAITPVLTQQPISKSQLQAQSEPCDSTNSQPTQPNRPKPVPARNDPPAPKASVARGVTMPSSPAVRPQRKVQPRKPPPDRPRPIDAAKHDPKFRILAGTRVERAQPAPDRPRASKPEPPAPALDGRSAVSPDAPPISVATQKPLAGPAAALQLDPLPILPPTGSNPAKPVPLATEPAPTRADGAPEAISATPAKVENDPVEPRFESDATSQPWHSLAHVPQEPQFAPEVCRAAPLSASATADMVTAPAPTRIPYTGVPGATAPASIPDAPTESRAGSPPSTPLFNPLAGNSAAVSVSTASTPATPLAFHGILKPLTDPQTEAPPASVDATPQKPDPPLPQRPDSSATPATPQASERVAAAAPSPIAAARNTEHAPAEDPAERKAAVFTATAQPEVQPSRWSPAAQPVPAPPATSSDRTAPPPAPAPKAVPEIIEPPKAPSQAVHDIKLDLSAGDRRVEVHVEDRAGELRVAVHTPDERLAGDLRDHLPSLSSRLEQTGLRAETWHAAGGGERLRTAQAASPSDAQSSGNHGNSNSREREQDAPPRRPRLPEAVPDREKGEDFQWLLDALR